MQPFNFFILAFFAAVTYISLDVAFSFTTVFGPSNPPQNLHSIPLFILTSIWPAACVLLVLDLGFSSTDHDNTARQYCTSA